MARSLQEVEEMKLLLWVENMGVDMQSLI
jgi:hypothetical protein